MFEFLPNEILLRVFTNLNHKDLKSVSQVSRRIFTIATDPSLWREFYIGELFSTEEQIKLLGLPRFQKLKSFEISNTDINGEPDEDPDYTAENMNKILKLLTEIDLEIVTFRMFDFKGIDQKLLSEVVRNTKIVRLEANRHRDLAENQLLEILENIPGGKVRYLQFDHVDFYNICPSKVARAINGVDAFASEYCVFTPEQVYKIFQEMSGDTKLKIFSSSYHVRSFLSSVAPRMLALALNNLEYLYLGSEGGNLSSEQMFEFFLQMSNETRLQRVFLTGPDSPGSPLLQTIPANILSGAIHQLEAFVAPQLLFSPGQTKSVMETIAMETSSIKRIDLGSTTAPTLSNIELATLRKIMNKIENNAFKFLVQNKVIETYDETIRGLREELREREETQVELNRMRRQLRRQSEEITRRLHVRVQRLVDRAVTRGKIQRPSKSASYNRFKAKASSKKTLKQKLHVKIIKK